MVIPRIPTGGDALDQQIANSHDVCRGSGDIDPVGTGCEN
jgi:hypothetical protein